MKPQDIAQLGMLAVVGFLLWKLLQKGEEYKEKTTDALAALWLRLNPLPGKIELIGNVKFPGGLFIPIQQFSDAKLIRQDATGRVFVQHEGALWQLQPQTFGYWPAVKVS